jgi:hypothetical protein
MSFNSECPQEALEAVSTLIFAAARFPDLPELCDLRHMFTERYGSSVEPFVNSEVPEILFLSCLLSWSPSFGTYHLIWPLCGQFVQYLQNKSFTNEEKLQVMKSVAEEFSVPFDSKALEWKITCGTQNKHVRFQSTFLHYIYGVIRFFFLK